VPVKLAPLCATLSPIHFKSRVARPFTERYYPHLASRIAFGKGIGYVTKL